MAELVQTGADRLGSLGWRYLQGKRYGLLTAPTGVTSDFVSTIDACADLQTGRLTALFACEHGIRGDRQFGVTFDDETDPVLGIPVYSLYSESRRKPADYMLENLDAVVFDIQDLGIRFYTYLSTLIYAMQACAEFGKSFIVLDRPNPLGGTRWEGGLLEDGYQSMVGAWTIPVQTGMTIGEFALYVNDRLEQPCELYVVPMDGWKRGMTYYDTGLPWILPSPNMPTLDTVTVYAGNCVIEGTNLSEGRGTTKPYEMIGAPWLNARKLAKTLNGLSLPGVHFRPVTFSPTISKHKGELCEGVFTHVTDKTAYRSVTTGLYLLHHIIDQHGESFQWLPPYGKGEDAKPFIDLLTGSDLVRRTVGEASGLRRIIDRWEEDCAAWREIREPYLLYGSDGTADGD